METTIGGLLAIANKIAGGNSVLRRDLTELARGMYKNNLTTAQQKHLGNLINDSLPGKPIAWEYEFPKSTPWIRNQRRS